MTPTPPPAIGEYDEVGHQRPDGKRNVWRKIFLQPADPQRVWVIVHVADTLALANEWASQQQQLRKEQQRSRYHAKHEGI